MARPPLVIARSANEPPITQDWELEAVEWSCTECDHINLGMVEHTPIGRATNQCERCETPHEVRMPSFKYQTCPNCRRVFRLNWNDYSNLEGEYATLLLRGCPSGGLYDARIRCPHCEHEEEL